MALMKINLVLMVSSLGFVLLFSHCSSMVAMASSTTNSSIQQEPNQIVPNSKDLVDHFCKQTSNHDLCVSTINSDPRNGLKKDPRGFLLIIIDQALSNTTTTYPHIGELLNKTKDHFTKSCLSVCYTTYQENIGYLKRAAGLVDFKDADTYRTLNQLASFVADDTDMCEREFADSPTVKSPLTSINKYVIDLCLIAMEIMNLIECNQITGCQSA